MNRFPAFASLLAIAAFPAWPQGQITAVVNAATFQSGLPSGGALATIFCAGLPLSVVKPGTYVASTSSPFPYVLGGLQVIINNAPSPILAVVISSSGQSASAQINLQVPIERSTSLLANQPATPPNFYPGSLEVQVLSGLSVVGGASVADFPAPPSWGGFFADANGYAIAQHSSDYSLVTPQNPAHAGESIVAYADDFFPVWPSPPTGVLAPQETLYRILPPYLVYSPNFLVELSSTYLYLQAYPQPDCSVFFGTSCYSFTNTPPVQVTFEGQIGVEQINFVVPANQQPGNWALFFNVGSCTQAPFTAGACGNGASSPYVLLPVQ